MKKLFYFLAIALVAATACQQKQDPEPTPGPGPGPTPVTPTELVLKTDAIVDLAAESGITTIKFTTNAAWTASVAGVPEGAVVLGATSGAAGEDIELKVTYQNIPDEDLGRIFSVTIKADDKTVKVEFYQGLVFYCNDPEVELGVAGGKAEYTIYTNLEYTIKKYDGPDQAFPFAPVTINEGNHYVKVLFDVAANAGYDSRYAYVKFTIPAIQVDVYDEETGEPTGETEDYTTRFYVYQEGNAKAAYTVALPADIEHGELNANANVTLAYFGGKLLMSDGLKLYAFNPETGAAIAAPAVPESLPLQSITNDDAGNVLFANAAGYGETINIYAIPASASDLSNPTLVATDVVSAWTGAPIADNVRAKGNVFDEAVISVLMGGGPGCESISYGMYWEVKAGAAGAAQYLACPDNVTDTIWLSNRGCFAPAGVSAADGFLYIGYDGLYTLFFNNGSEWIAVTETGCAGNEGFNAIASTVWNGKKLVAFEEMFYFPFWWSAPSAIWLVDVTNGTPELISYPYIYMSDDATPATDSNSEGSTSDILLHIEGENLAIYVVDSSIGVLHKQVYPKL